MRVPFITMTSHRPNLSVFYDVRKCSVGNRTLLSGCGEQAIVLAIGCDVWRFYGAPLAKDSTKCNPVLALEVLLDVMNCLVGALYPPLFDGSI